MSRSFMINTCSLSAITQHIAHAWKKGVSAFVSCLRIDLLCEMWFLQCNKCFAYGRETSSWRISGETFKFTGEKKHARHGSTATSFFLPLNSSMEEWIGDASVATRWAPPQVNKSDGCFTWSPCTGIYHFDFCLFPSCEKRSISTRSTFLLLSSEVCFKGAGRSLTFLKSQHHSLTQFNCLIKIESKSHQIYDDVVFVSGHVTRA